MQQIPDHDRDAGLQPVQDHIVAGEPDEVALHFEPDDPRMRHSRGEAQHRRARPATDVEHQLVRFGGDRSGEEHRVDRDAVAAGRLPQPNAPAEQPVLGEGGLARSPSSLIALLRRRPRGPSGRGE